MTGIKRMTFTVETAADMTDLEHTQVHDLTVILADQVRAEREARKLGGINLKTDPITGTAMWCWAAMVRLGLTEASFHDWHLGVVGIGDPDETDVDPTTRAAASD